MTRYQHFLWIIFLAGFISVGHAQEKTYSVAYAGRTLGYLRVTETQDVAHTECRDVDKSPITESALEQFRKWGKDNVVIVATGDNFAPDLYGRQMRSNEGELLPKEMFSWNYLTNPPAWRRDSPDDRNSELDKSLDKGVGIVGFDNVGCFLKLTGFTALVPGKLDFHFGPERLRQLARYLANPSPDEKAVQMLAANLTVTSSIANPSPQTTAARTRTRGFRTSDAKTKIGLPRVVLPYLGKITVTDAIAASLNNVPVQSKEISEASSKQLIVASTPLPYGYLCTAPDPASFELPPKDPKQCNRLDSVPDPIHKTDMTFSVHDNGGRLKAGAHYFFCIGDLGHQPLCNGFTVHYPFFEYVDPRADREKVTCPGPTKPSPPIACKDPLPWAMSRDESVAVFGIVTPDLAEHVGLLNYSWANNDPALNTIMQVIDPGEALTQVLQACDKDDRCKNARKILLAEMTGAQANELAVHFKQFDAVITQPDTALATPDETIEGSRGGPFVLTPAIAVDENPEDDNTRILRLAKADITIEDGRRRKLHTTTLHAPKHIQRHVGFGPNLRDRIKMSPLAKELGLNPDLTDSEVLETVGLSAMRNHCTADVALLQHRDLYKPGERMDEPAGMSSLQQVLDEAFWKGDFVICTQGTGAGLKDIMAQSDKFDAADRDQLSTELEKSRGVAILGMTQDSDSKQFIIAGMPIEPAKLYAVAITDYLVSGDTGYPALAKPAVPPADRFQNEKRLYELASIVCRSIQSDLCRKPIGGGEYFDGSTLGLYDRPAVGRLPWITQWLQHNWTIHRFTDNSKAAQVNAQQQRRLSLTLDKLDAGYALHLHTLSENELKTRLAGIQQSAITAAEERDFTGDYSYRLILSGRRPDWFVSGQSNYAEKATRTTFLHTLPEGTKLYDSPYILNQSQNSFIQEEGVGWRAYPDKKNLSFIKLQTTVHLETQLVRPDLQLQLVDNQTAGSQPQLSLPDRIRSIPRNYYLLGRLGPRLQSEKSWIEVGYESGEQFNKPVSYAFLPPGVDSPLSELAVTCDLSSTTSLQDCVKKPNAARTYVAREWMLRVSTVNRPRTGGYLNFKLNLPSPVAGLGLTLENQGELFRHSGSDTRLDTRYYDDLTSTVTVPVWGNFSLAPKLDTYLYKNMVDNTFVRVFATSVTLKYRFDWHQGVGFGKALKYANPAPAP